MWIDSRQPPDLSTYAIDQQMSSDEQRQTAVSDFAAFTSVIASNRR